MEPLNALLSSRDHVSEGDATESPQMTAGVVGEPQSDLLSPVVYRANGRSEPQETNRLRKGLNRISTDSATSTYEMVDANGSSQSPGSDDSSSTSTDGHGGDGEEEDDEEEEDAMWSNIVRINKATSATVAELTGSSSGGPDTGDPVNEIEYEVQEAMVSGVAMAIGSFDHEVGEREEASGEEGGSEGGGGGGACELLQRKRFDLARSSTKEEKQRHNEEILIMKSNSLSSDTTNSWEPISVEACYPEPAQDEAQPVQPPAAAPSKACFIDASSLFDDDEIVYPSFQDPPVAWSSAGTTRSASSTTVGNEPSVQLSTILLCDDVKIRSESERPSAATMEVKDQFCARPTNEFLAAKLKLPELVESHADDCTEEVLARQQSERKQGTMLFQNSIQQFSGLQLDAAPAGGPAFSTAEEPCSDLSLPSVYSSGSERNYGEYSSLSISDTQRYSLSSAAGAYGGTIDESGGGRGESFRCTSTSGYNSSSADYNSRTQATSDVESGHYPNTPFNSIVHVTSSQHGSLTTTNPPRPYGDDGNGSRASSIDRESHSTPIRIPKRVQKHDESAPIVSGGASIEDFTPKQCESPSVRRRTDTCPIVSGGISFEEDPRDALLAGQGRRLSKSSSGKSWVVDLKNCPDDEKQTTGVIGSLDGQQQQRHHQQPRNCGLGFYVDLGSLKTPEEEKPITEVHRPRPAVRADLMKKSTGFYIDLSDGESTRSATPKLSGRNDTPPPSAVPRIGDEDGTPSKVDSREESMEKDRKNMFSMFIDFGDEKNGNTTIAKPPVMLRKHSLPQAASGTSINGKDPPGTERPNSLGPSGEEGTKPYYMFIGATAATEPTPVVRRPIATGAATASGSQVRNESKRHSWNTSTFGGEHSGGFHERRIANSASYQRSTSVTSDRGIMNILDKIPLLSKTSSMSIDSSVSPFEDFTCSKSELSTYSNQSVSSNSGHSSNESKVSPAKETDGGGPSGEPPVEITPAMGASVKRKRKDVKLNETFDKSSQGSVTDGILSSNEDASPTSTTTDTDDVTFQNNPVDEEALLAAAANGTVNQEEPVECPVKLAALTGATSKQMETIEEAVESSPRHGAATAPRKAQHTMETLHATIEKQKQLLETVSENVESSGVTSFVKLSDMDKPPPPPATQSVTVTKFELHSSSSVAGSSSTGGGTSNMSNSAGSNRVARLFECQKYNTIGSAVGASQAMRLQHQQQKSSNYYQNNGVTSMERHSWNMSRSTGNNFVSLISSSVENSRSLSRLFPHLSKAFSNSLPSDVGMNGAGRGQDGSELLHSDFSCTSSITSSRSGIESIDESISSRQPRRLGEDLLKMFLQEIATDVTIEVETRKMRAHKCILRSRCQYFAAILAGSWVQNAGNVIALPGYSYAAVHFALCHIYSGASHPPEGISLMELAALSDLLGLEGLKEVTAYALKTNYCHNFHKPCVGCTDGVLQVLPVTLNHGLDDLYRKCLKWVCRHYVKIWSQKQFSQLPLDVVHRCRQQIVAHLSSESVLTLILDSEQLLTLLHPYKWSVEVENVVRDILDAAYDYITDHFASLLASDSFLSLGQNYRWAIPHVEPILLPAANNLSPDQACKSYPRATRLHKLLQAKVLTMTTTTTTTTTTATPLSGDKNTSVVNVYEKQGKRQKDDYKRHEEEEEMDWCDEFVGMVNAILSAVEQCLIRQCARAMRVSSWQRMDVELRNKVQKLACLMETADERKSRSRYSFSSQTSSSSSVHSRTNDLRQVRLAIQAHNKRAYEGNGNANTNRTQQTQTTVAQHNDLNSALLASHKLAKHLDDDMQRKQKEHQPPLENGYRISRTSSKTNHTAPVPESGRKAPVAANTVRQTNGIAMGLLAKTNRRDASAPPLVEAPSHRRSQSEDHAVYGSVKQPPTGGGCKGETVANLRSKLSHIKPRYLEPKKPKNAANLQAQNNNISSSGSSTRTASPAFGHRNKLKQQPATAMATTTVVVKGGHESNISLDSLTSPAKLRNGGVPAKAPRSTISELDVSIDSLAESLKSNSIKTSNTLSHESLIYHDYFKPKQITDHQPVPNGLSARERRNKVPPVATARPPTAVSNGGAAKPIHNSSIPRSNGINRTGSSASVGSSNGGGIKRSFLSQRSREILARRSHEPKSNSTNSSNKSAASSPSLLLARDKSTTGSDITKSGSSASLSTTNSGGGGGTTGCGRKVFNTTLHLRRTAKLLPAPGPQDNPTSRQQTPLKSSSSSSVHRRIGDRNSLKTAGRKVDSTVPANRVPLKHMPVTGTGNNYGGPPASLPPIATTTTAGRIESKLERSNTFSMDASDNTLVLQLLD